MPLMQRAVRSLSNLQMIEMLCGIVELQSNIIKAQSLQLGELGVVMMQDEIAEADKKLSYLLGCGEDPPFL